MSSDEAGMLRVEIDQVQRISAEHRADHAIA